MLNESLPAANSRAISSGDRRSFPIQVWRAVRRVPLYVLAIALGLLFVLPFIWMLSTALKFDKQVFAVPLQWIPRPVDFSNFVGGLTRLPFGHYFLNTLLYALGATIGTVLSCSIVAYGFSRIQWRGRDTVFWLVLATMMLPFQVTMIPLYLMFRDLGWLNTYLPLVVPTFFANSAFSIFLLRQFFRSIPMELSEAARVDGANELVILFRIILPLSIPSLAVVGLFQFMQAWNNYLGPLIYINDSSKYPLALGLQQLQTTGSQEYLPQQWPQLMAASTAVMFPVLAIYFFTQRVFVQGIVTSGMKG